MLPAFGCITLKELVFSQNCFTVLTNEARDGSPEIFSYKMEGKVQNYLFISNTKLTCLPVFLMVTEHEAVQLPWLTNELNRV